MNILDDEPVYQPAPAVMNTADVPTNYDDLRPVPRVSVQAFCETAETSNAIQQAAQDRRMMKAHVKIHTGGIAAAAEFYSNAPTPNVIIVESRARPDMLLADLDRLAEVCDPGTNVLVVGHLNDVLLFRELLRRGVSEYIVAPIDRMQVIRSVSDLYADPEAEPLGRTYAFIGAKGGVGSSTVAHNVAWSLSSGSETDVVLADLDLAFGTVGLDFNQDPPQGIAEAVFSPDRMDEVFLDRLLSKCADHLSILAAPSSLERAYDFEEGAFDNVIEVIQKGVPAVVLDLPHAWTSWSRRILSMVDEVVIVAEPDLANLRNTKNLMDLTRSLRPNDAAPRLVLNRVGMMKRPEIRPADFAAALQVEPLAEIPFDPGLFGTASNNGQMVAEMQATHKVAEEFGTIGQVLSGRMETKRQKKSGLDGLLSKLRGKKD